jgi:hypothetical protein
MKHTAVDTVSWHFVYPRRQEFDPYVRIDFGLVLPLPRYSVKPGGGGVIMVILNCALLIRWILALNSVSPAAVSPQFLTRLHRLRLGTMLHRNEGEGEGERERERKGGREGGRGGGRERGREGGGGKKERERKRERENDGCWTRFRRHRRSCYYICLRFVIAMPHPLPFFFTSITAVDPRFPGLSLWTLLPILPLPLRRRRMAGFLQGLWQNIILL